MAGFAPDDFDGPTMPPRTVMTRAGEPAGGALERAVTAALALAEGAAPLLPDAVLTMAGMSGRRYRGFISALLSAMERPRYLEVGSWAGSTLVAALHRNPHVQAVAVDNWSEFGGPRDLFWQNVDRHARRMGLTVLEQDFRTVDFAALAPVDVYLFDGPHQENDQFDGMVMGAPALADRAVVIVDDWNWDRVRRGTRRGLAAAGLRVRAEVEIRTTTDDVFPAVSRQHSDWHNGYFIAVVEKPAA